MDLPLHLHPNAKGWLLDSVPAMKDRALARLQVPESKVRLYRAPDGLLQFLKTL
jgi:hypothetical protein